MKYPELMRELRQDWDLSQEKIAKTLGLTDKK